MSSELHTPPSSKFHRGDHVTTRTTVEAYYSGQHGNPRCTFEYGDEGIISAINVPDEEGRLYCCVDFQKEGIPYGDGTLPWRGRVYYENLVLLSCPHREPTQSTSIVSLVVAALGAERIAYFDSLSYPVPRRLVAVTSAIKQLADEKKIDDSYYVTAFLLAYLLQESYGLSDEVIRRLLSMKVRDLVTFIERANLHCETTNPVTDGDFIDFVRRSLQPHPKIHEGEKGSFQ